MVVFDCRKVAESIKERCRNIIKDTLKEHDEYPAPCLAVIQVGDNPASNAYVRNKVKSCEEVGIESKVIKMPESASYNSIAAQIYNLNDDVLVDGILLQLPLPKHLDEENLIECISAEKDVDKLTKECRMYGEIPCTPLGIIRLFEHEKIEVEGKHIVIIGRSDLVGRPLARIFSGYDYNATVTLCNSHTKNLESIIASADIVISCVGKRGIIKNGMLSSHAILIDVGINKDEEGKLIGDAERDVECFAKTVVPKGVGLLTVAALMENTISAWLES